MDKQHQKVTPRNDVFADKVSTRIWEETPSDENPYIADSSRCHGYDLIELMQGRSYVDVLYLLFRGDLPSAHERQLLEQLMIGLINPGPRHPATRAAMNAGIGKTESEHILPIGLAVISGTHLGAGEIEGSMRFLRKHARKSPDQVVEELLAIPSRPDEGDWHVVPGFGSRYGSVDIVPNKMAENLASQNDDWKMLQWGCEFSRLLSSYHMGWLATGLAAAVFADLGFQPRYGAGLFQLISAPGILAHGMEQSNKPVTAMPFVKDENYVIEN